jgi:hypothetical protein
MRCSNRRECEILEKLSIDRRIEILITDFNMPGMDGHELP